MRSRPADRLGASRRGFTLIELMAALTLTGFALLGARSLLVQLTDGSGRLRAAATTDARVANGDRLLRQLVRHAELVEDSTARFTGTSSHAGFSSWSVAPGGWLRRSRVRLALEQHGDSTKVVATLDGLTLVLTRHPGDAELRYFESGRGWLRSWTNALALPSAIGVASERDTTVLVLGVRP
ncbi:MAG: PulJ/GspJ family protein [Gemmatimonadaceae bacterium]